MPRWCIADASLIHRRCIADVWAVRRDLLTPSAPTPRRRPLRSVPGAPDAPRAPYPRIAPRAASALGAPRARRAQSV
eukprot:5002213-Pyramimonas_sp.AAC.1